MVNYAVILAAALTFALPAIADNSVNTSAKPKTKAPGTISVQSFSHGTSNVVLTKGNGTAAGKVSVGNIHVNPCQQPNPPHDCARPRPPH
jgi:hypothetical protein